MNAKKAKRARFARRAYALASIAIISFLFTYAAFNYAATRAAEYATASVTVDSFRSDVSPSLAQNVTITRQDAQSVEWIGHGSGQLIVDIPQDSIVNVTLASTREGRLTLLHAPSDAFAWKNGTQLTLEVAVNAGSLTFAYTSDVFDVSYVATATWRNHE